MLYTFKEIREILEMEGCPDNPEDRNKDYGANLFPSDLNLGRELDEVESLVGEAFLSFYRNKEVECFYIDGSSDYSDRVGEIKSWIEDLYSNFTFKTEYILVKRVDSHTVLFYYENVDEAGAEPVVGILY